MLLRRPRKPGRAMLAAAIVLVLIFLALGIASICLANKPCQANTTARRDLDGNLCPTAGPGVVLNNDQYVPNLVQTQPPVLGVEASSNRVVVLSQICPEGDFKDYQCTFDNNKHCKACNKTKPTTYDPSTWVTCSPSECQGSFTMKPQQGCNKYAMPAPLAVKNNNSQRGTDIQGMFGCLSGKGNKCPFDDTMGAACQAQKCSAFVASSDYYSACDASGTTPSWEPDDVAFDPFGNDLSDST